jgi:hypothetical protein
MFDFYTHSGPIAKHRDASRFIRVFESGAMC